MGTPVDSGLSLNLKPVEFPKSLVAAAPGGSRVPPRPHRTRLRRVHSRAAAVHARRRTRLCRGAAAAALGSVGASSLKLAPQPDPAGPSAMDTVAPSGCKTWVDICFEHLCLQGLVHFVFLISWCRVSREWTR